MSFTLGFVLITHNEPQQAARLVRRLNAMFGAPPIAWHHDFSKSPQLPPDCITSNVTLVRPHLETAWARFPVVEAAMRALETLYASDRAPDAFVLLSGADYPIKPADQILRDLSTSPYDAHIAHEKIVYNRYERAWHEVCYARYCTARLKLWPGRNAKPLDISHPVLAAPFLPFSRRLSCYAGEFWFSARRSAAEYLIAFHRSKPQLANHYRGLAFPEESYFQTILCNSSLRVSRNHWRYIDWSSTTGSLPKVLAMADLPRLRVSSAHFARKVNPAVSADLLDALDADIL
ncbi:MAG: beta-1,6-N-acetylglucosaminyltransferase [Xanthobacteraceae bacterium]|nr:beta-1,6-N-acetylglucosaminyltransferase [Xanthobacteraceae bacterium]